MPLGRFGLGTLPQAGPSGPGLPTRGASWQVPSTSRQPLHGSWGRAARGGQQQQASKHACAWIKGSYGFPFVFAHLLLFFKIHGNNLSQYQSMKELNELLMPTLPWNMDTEQGRGPYAASRLPLIPEVGFLGSQLW